MRTRGWGLSLQQTQRYYQQSSTLAIALRPLASRLIDRRGSQHSSAWYSQRLRAQAEDNLSVGRLDTVLSNQAHDYAGKPLKLHDEGWHLSLYKLLLSVKEQATQKEVYKSGSEYHISALIGRIANLLVQAREEGHVDLLASLGLRLGQWQDVLWIIEGIVKDQSIKSVHKAINLESGIRWMSRPFRNLTAPQNFNFDHSLTHGRVNDDVQLTPKDHFESWERSLNKADGPTQALGQILRSLGNMVIHAARSDQAEAATIMSIVLQALAIMHRNDVIADSVYQFVPRSDPVALHQPPTLFLLSNTIMSIMANAAFEAQRPGLFDGRREADPLAMHRFSTQQLGPEIWLELVLWTCLHGPWIDDGLAILRQLQESGSWKLISWRDVLDAASSSEVMSLSAQDWYELRRNVGTRRGEAKYQDRRAVERTISTELIAAYVQGLVHKAESGSSAASGDVSDILSDLESLQQFLERQHMGLGYTTWDAVCMQLVEAMGDRQDVDPSFLLRLTRLAQPFGRELSSVNLQAPSRSWSSSRSDYIFEPTAAPLGLLHRALDAYCTDGNVDGALRTLKALQDYTDLNKRRSLQTFFEHLRQRSQVPDSETSQMVDFASPILAKEYPSFFPQLPVVTARKLLDLVTSARLFALGDWLLFSEDIDGAIIPTRMQKDHTFTPALIRYATAVGDKPLLADILAQQSELGASGQSFLPIDTVHALLHSQIEQGLWEAAFSVLRLIKETPRLWWTAETSVLVAKQMLKLQATKSSASQQEQETTKANQLGQATNMLRLLMTRKYGPPYVSNTTDFHRNQVEDVLHNILCCLASINPAWSDFCSVKLRLRAVPASRRLQFPIPAFENILDGVCLAHGSQAGRQLWERWCHDLPYVPPTLDNYFNDEKRRVVIERGDRLTLLLQGRIKPRLSTIRVILRRLLDERGSFDLPTAASDGADESIDKQKEDKDVSTLRWALRNLDHLVERKEDRKRELQRLIDAKKMATGQHRAAPA